jgi:hypothetical protein
MQSFHLDLEKYKKGRRHLVFTYVLLALVSLGIIYMYVGEMLFGSVWILIPCSLLAVGLLGHVGLTKRMKFWDGFELTLDEEGLTRTAPDSKTIEVKKADFTGVREIKEGLVLSTAENENAMLVPRQLFDKDYQALKEILESWPVKEA